MTLTNQAIIMAGISAKNLALYHRIRFLLGDPAVYLELPANEDREKRQSILIVRDIEMQRAQQHARADIIACPADYVSARQRSGDRETATAQAAAECLRQNRIKTIVADRTLSLIYLHELEKAGIEVQYDAELGVAQRRAKDALEIAHLREAQQVTEQAMRMACEMVGRATVGANGVLMHEGEALTSERVRTAIDLFLVARGYSNAGSIVAGGPIGADCHHRGAGELRTGEPVMIDIFPRNNQTLYNGDCTRTVVHGDIPAEVARMHAAVVEAKAKAIATIRTDTTGETVHAVTTGVIEKHGYQVGMPPENAPDDWCGMMHGTGHGIGLEVHELPLLDKKGPALVLGDVVTIEPGLYCKAIGGVRIEDMVVVQANHAENLNTLPESLTWK